MNATEEQVLASRSNKSLDGQCRVSVRLLKLIEDTHYQLVQENGQRRLTSPDLTHEIREKLKGAEVFLGRLPRDCYEDELMPVLDTVGRLMELRLMLDFSGTTRGYAFALYENAKVAKLACQKLDGYQLRPGHRIGVVKSIDNCRLFFGGVPKDKTKAEFAAELSKILDGISEIYLYPNALDPRQNRGFIFVEFKDHRSAAMARRKLIPGRVVLWNHEIAVDWADPEPGDPVDEEIMETVTALFVRNLQIDLPHQKVREVFHKSTGIPILKLKKINHFAFVHYETRELAEKAFDILNASRGVSEQYNWEIRWAKPIGASKAQERQRSLNEAIVAGKLHEQQQQTQLLLQKHAEISLNKRSKRKGKNSSISPTLSHSSDINRTAVLPISPPQRILHQTAEHIDYKKLLEQYASQKLFAICQFTCYQIYGPPGFMCKIILIRNDHVIYDYSGDLYFSQDVAINMTSRDVYYRLTNNATQEQMIATSYPSNSYPPNRLETCH